MRFLLALSRGIDRITRAIGWLATWAVLIACLISVGNAISRYAFSASSNAWLEIQWYLFGVMFLLGAAYTLQRNEHVRVDVLYNNLSARGRAWIDLLGGILFLLPAAIAMGWMTWRYFLNSYEIGEMSNNAGGLIRWPVKLLMPVGFSLLALQGLSEIIKNAALLAGYSEPIAKYEKPLQ